MKTSDVKSLATDTISNWSKHEAPRLGAALAFYTILSIAPLVILVIAIAGLIVGRSTAQYQIIHQVHSMVGDQGASAVQAMIDHAKKPSSGVLASIIGIITLLFGASGVLTELRASLNTIWEVKPKDGSGVMSYVREKFFSFGLVMAVGFLLMVSLFVSATLASIGKFFGGLLPFPTWALSAINFVISLIGISAMFALIFRFVPERRARWRDLWEGSLVTGLLFTIGELLIGLYLGKVSVASPYGAAGSLVVVVVWVYYSSLIFFLGAEFTWTLLQRKQPALAAEVAAQQPSTRHPKAA